MERIQVIESTQNPRVKHAVKLRKARVRRETEQTLVEGFREITRATENGWQFIELYFCPELYLDSKAEKLIDSLKESALPLFRCSEAVFRKISYRDTPDGLIALSPAVGWKLNALCLPENPLLLVTENIEKPGNLGTILRSAEAAGANAVIVCGNKTDINNPNTIRASIGTLFYLPVAETSTEEAIHWLKKQGIKTVAAVPNAKITYTDTDLRHGVAIIVGSEDTGLTSQWQTGADLHVSIPMHGANDSLNVSTAAALILFEAVRQRRA